MDFRYLVGDEALRAEILDRIDEIADALPGGLESIDSRMAHDALAGGLESMAAGSWQEGTDSSLEAIILRFARPVLLVQDETFKPVVDGFPESRIVTDLLTTARSQLETAIAGVGRIDLKNHRLEYAGTGWVVAPGIAVTNRHVAEEFATRTGGGFAFRDAGYGRMVGASIDWRREHQRGEESLTPVTGVAWIEDDKGPDVALLRIGATDLAGQPPPQPLTLMDEVEIGGSVDAWTAVIGYPAFDSRNDRADQQRIYDGIYNVKRLSPGRILSVSPDGLLTHDATTLGGNSGSVVVDLATGKAVGLHFGGSEGDRNYAVQASVVADLVERHG